MTNLLAHLRDELGPVYYDARRTEDENGKPRWAVYVLRRNCTIDQLPGTHATAAEANAVARKAAEQAGCNWHAVNGP